MIANEIENLNSSDPAIHDRAFQNLVKMGAEAVPSLLEFLGNKQSHNRALAAAAIATIADGAYADRILKYTDDEEEEVRAWSAVALRKMNDPRALPALLKTINDYPDEAHYDQTLTTYALIQWGEEVLPPVIDLLNAPDAQTRTHAFAVLKKIVFNKVKTKEGWEKLWKENGSYDPASDADSRLKAAEKWKAWV